MRILLFDIDCLRPDHLGCYGYDRPTSPNIDAVAAQGATFHNYYCSDSPCAPSRAGLISGRFGFNNGMVSNVGAGAQFRIRHTPYRGPHPDNELLMRRLRQAGWDTVSFSNFADRHSFPWFMIGWSEFHTINLKGGAETAEEINEQLLPWLKQNATRDNFLLHVNYWDTHRTYKMDAGWTDRFDDHPVSQSWPDEDTVARHQHCTGPFAARQQFRNNVSTTPLMPGAVSNRRDFEQMLTGYDASIAYVDYHLGQALDELDRQGVLDETAIIITADHGDAFGEHGVYSDHVCADETIHHIPLIVRWPGVTPAGLQDRSLLANVDLSATLLDLLGAEKPIDWDGESFAENLKGNPGLDHDHLVWGHALYTVQRAVRTRRHLMIRTYDQMEFDWDPIHLYDMENDPFMTTNLCDAEPSTVGQCDQLMNEWLDQQRSKHGVARDPFELVLEERAERRVTPTAVRQERKEAI